MNKLLLRLALLPSGLWKSMGADTGQLQALLDVKLKLDDRRPVGFGRNRTEKKNRRFSLIWGMVISFISGLIYVMPLLVFRNDMLLALSAFFVLFLFMLSFTLISDFSTVLVDTRDKFIVLPRPVNDRTLFLSRMLHIFIYLFRIVLPMSLPGWILLGLMHGWKAAIWYPVPILLITFTALFLVMGVYMLILKLTAPGRFKDILGYLQIAFSILFFAMIYIGPRALKSEAVLNMTMNDFFWMKYIPPFWIASTWSWINFHGVPTDTIWFSILAVLFPVIALWVTVKFFAPSFTARLGGMDETDSAPVSTKRTGNASKHSLGEKLSLLMNKNKEAQAGFLLTWLQSARSRSFKMRIYPSFAYWPIYFIYILLQSDAPVRQVWAELPETKKHLTLLYICSFVVIQVLTVITISSEHYKAAWIYYATPLKQPGNVMAGSFKAVWVKYFLPFYLFISAFVLAVWGTPAIGDVILAFINITLFAVCIARATARVFPFSVMDQMSNSGSKVLKVVLSMLVPLLLGTAHYLSLKVWWLKFLFMGLSGTFLWLVWDSYVNTQWKNMKEADI